jgi:hypothetical protein
MPSPLVIREIAHDSPDYWAVVSLRDRILRQPLGLQYSLEQLRAEGETRHFACYEDERLVGCLILLSSTTKYNQESQGTRCPFGK